MNADQLKKLTTDALDRLGALLDAGQSDQLTAMLKTMARFHRYSVNNVCLISAQRPDATRVAGFHAWRSLGRFVRKGEKGIVILAPIVGRRTDAEDDESRQVVGFRAAYVFDVSQTDGEPLPEIADASGDPGTHTAALRKAIATRGISIEEVDDLDGALGTSAGGRIQIVKRLAPPQEFSVLAHEFAHELLHHAGDRPVLQLIQIVEQFRFLLRQARRLPFDMVSRYHGHSVDWTLHDLEAGLLYARAASSRR